MNADSFQDSSASPMPAPSMSQLTTSPKKKPRAKATSSPRKNSRPTDGSSPAKKKASKKTKPKEADCAEVGVKQEKIDDAASVSKLHKSDPHCAKHVNDDIKPEPVKAEPASGCNTRQDTETSSSKDTDRTSWESCLPTAEMSSYERILEWQKKNDESNQLEAQRSLEKVARSPQSRQLPFIFHVIRTTQ